VIYLEHLALGPSPDDLSIRATALTAGNLKKHRSWLLPSESCCLLLALVDDVLSDVVEERQTKKKPRTSLLTANLHRGASQALFHSTFRHLPAREIGDIVKSPTSDQVKVTRAGRTGRTHNLRRLHQYAQGLADFANAQPDRLNPVTVQIGWGQVVIYASGLEHVNKLPLEEVELIATSEAHRWMAISAVLEGAFQLLSARLSPVNRTRLGLNARAQSVLEQMNLMFPLFRGEDSDLSVDHLFGGEPWLAKGDAHPLKGSGVPRADRFNATPGGRAETLIYASRFAHLSRRAGVS
jgi:hypothetical protein